MAVEPVIVALVAVVVPKLLVPQESVESSYSYPLPLPLPPLSLPALAFLRMAHVADTSCLLRASW